MHPMNSIDDKAKNEIQELLQELVVSPVSKELGDKVTQLEESLSELQKVPGKFNILIGLIESKADNISNKLEIIDDISSNIISCEGLCKDIKVKSEKLNDIQSKVIELLSILNNSKIDELRTTLLESSKQVSNIEKDISNQLQCVSQSIDNKFHTQNDSIDGISISLENKYSKVSEDYKRLYKQNRTSFLIIITLSVINMLGLIGLMMIHMFH